MELGTLKIPGAQQSISRRHSADGGGGIALPKFTRQRRWSATPVMPVQSSIKRKAKAHPVLDAPSDLEDDPSDAGPLSKHDLEAFTASLLIGRPVPTPPPWSPSDLTRDPSLESLEGPEHVRLPSLVLPAAAKTDSAWSVSSLETSSHAKVATMLNEFLPLTDTPATDFSNPKDKLRGMGKQVMKMNVAARGLGSLKESKPLMSLMELRRRLLQKWQTLKKAFAVLDYYIQHGEAPQYGTTGSMKSSGATRKAMSITEFSRGLAFFGLDAAQSHHFFRLMDKDGDGTLTLAEFRQALSDMPREILLQDFRERLASRHSSVQEACKTLVQDNDSRSQPLDKGLFTFKVSRWGVDENEAQYLFSMIDADESGTITIQELQEALREGSPWISLEEFWCRFAKQWPDITQSAGEGAHARRKATEKLCANLSSSNRPLSKEAPDSLTSEAFVELCGQLDINRSNAAELFVVCATSAKWQCRDHKRKDAELSSECDIDDFFDCLHLWSQNPLSKASVNLTPVERRRGSVKDVAKHLAPVRGVLKSLKEEFVPSKEFRRRSH